MGNHCLQQAGRAAEVVIVIFQRVGHGLAYLRGGGEVDNAFHLLLFKKRVQRCAVAYVHVIKARIGVNRSPETGLQIVGDYYLATCGDELVNRMGTDVAGSA